jgi:hypothetical protein
MATSAIPAAAGPVHLAGPKRKLEEGDGAFALCYLTSHTVRAGPHVVGLVLRAVVEVSPFAGIQKNLVMREAKIFSDSVLNPAKCSRVLTRVLYLITQGETFNSDESTELFFAVTKLFQSQDVCLTQRERERREEEEEE